MDCLGNRFRGVRDKGECFKWDELVFKECFDFNMKCFFTVLCVVL